MYAKGVSGAENGSQRGQKGTNGLKMAPNGLGGDVRGVLEGLRGRFLPQMDANSRKWGIRRGISAGKQEICMKTGGEKGIHRVFLDVSCFPAESGFRMAVGTRRVGATRPTRREREKPISNVEVGEIRAEGQGRARGRDLPWRQPSEAKRRCRRGRRRERCGRRERFSSGGGVRSRIPARSCRASCRQRPG